MKAFLLTIGCSHLALGFNPSSPLSRKSNFALAAEKEATFGMGCFWKPAEELLKVPGVTDTVAGYTGKPDAKKPPTYDSVCYGRDWVEGVRVYYNDEKISYQELLNAFFEAQEPKPSSRQYASMIFPHDNEQENIAQKWLISEKERTRGDGVPVRITQVEPLSKFYQAEGYHQRYWAKQRPRFAVVVGLLALSTSLVDEFIPVDMKSSLHDIALGLVVAVGLYIVLERKIDSKVVEL